MLTALETSLFDHLYKNIKKFIVTSDNTAMDGEYPDFSKSQMVFSLVDDERDHFRLVEKKLGKGREQSPKVKLPVCALVRGQINSVDGWNYSSSTYNIGDVVISVDGDRLEAITTSACLVQIEYQLVWYDNQFAYMNKMLQNWLLLSGKQMTVMEVDLADLGIIDTPLSGGRSKIYVSMTFGPPEATNPSRLEIEERGQYYKQSFPFEIESLLLPVSADQGVIETIDLDIFTFVPSDPSEVDEDDYSDSIQITETESSQGAELGTALSFSVQLAEDVGGHRAVTVDGYLCDVSSLDSVNKYLGVTTQAGEVGNSVNIRVRGELSDPSFDFTPSMPVLISEDGLLTQNVGTTDNYARRIGWAVDSNTLMLDPLPPIILS